MLYFQQKEIFMKINEISLFGGIREENLTEMLKCLDGREKSYI